MVGVDIVLAPAGACKGLTDDARTFVQSGTYLGVASL